MTIKWYWVALIIIVALFAGYMLGKKSASPTTSVVTQTPAVVTTTNTGTNG